MRKRNNWIYVLISILSASVIIFLCLFLSYYNSSNNYKKTLENNYRKSFYEVVDNVNSMEIDLSKLIATNNSETQRVLLASIYNTANLSVDNLNELPISYNKLTKINTLFNKTSGLSYSLLDKIFDGDNLTNNDYEQITQLHDSLIEIKYDLNKYMSNWKNNYNILDHVDFSGSSFSGGMVDTESSNTDVPSLIYDGPFSESVLNREIVGLENIECTKEQALEYLMTIFDGEISYVGMTNGRFVTYDFNVDNSLCVSVTKQGKFLITITSCSIGGGLNISVDDGIEIAENFATVIGIPNMYCVWSQVSNKILYVNLAPIVNHVIHYSDLIKVKVDLTSGKVVGWEATNYATNHRTRIFTQSMTIVNAMSRLSSALVVTERNYAIIPDKFVGEICAFEFICKWQNYTYYIYINSNTGAEANILRVVDTTNGELLS